MGTASIDPVSKLIWTSQSPHRTVFPDDESVVVVPVIEGASMSGDMGPDEFEHEIRKRKAMVKKVTALNLDIEVLREVLVIF
jgi:hypothetical protein